MKHTPGPWSATGAVILCSQGEVIASCDSAIHPVEQRRVDACLIATAPELLEALKELRRECLAMGSPRYKKISLVIDKAEGNSDE